MTSREVYDTRVKPNRSLSTNNSNTYILYQGQISREKTITLELATDTGLGTLSNSESSSPGLRLLSPRVAVPYTKLPQLSDGHINQLHHRSSLSNKSDKDKPIKSVEFQSTNENNTD